MAERLELQRAVAASAEEIFAVLTDPQRHVAIDSSGMLMQASGDIVTKVGDTFVVHMDREALIVAALMISESWLRVCGKCW